MAVLSPVNISGNGAITTTPAVLTSADTLVYNHGLTQILNLANTSGSSITLTIDGDGGTTVSVDGIGSVSVAAGLAITVPNNEARTVRLGSIREYLKGTVNLTGGTGLRAQLFEF